VGEELLEQVVEFYVPGAAEGRSHASRTQWQGRVHGGNSESAGWTVKTRRSAGGRTGLVRVDLACGDPNITLRYKNMHRPVGIEPTQYIMG